MAALCLWAGAAGAQGCSQCRDGVAQMPARTRAAYRRGIAVLVVAGVGVFGAGAMVARRFGR